MVSPGHAVCDVGCDHAYTSIALIQSSKCPYAVASDVRPGPLAAAAENIKAAGLSDVIDTCLADGVPEDVHERLPEGRKTLVITGMGGMLICQILERAGETAGIFDEMVLSPQSDIHLVRQRLKEMHFAITCEEMLIDEGKFYTVIRAGRDVPGMPGIEDGNRSNPERPSFGESENPCGTEGRERREMEDALRTEAEMLYGPVLLAGRHPVLREYLDKQERTLKAIRENLEKSGRSESDARVREVIRKMEVLREAQRYYEGH